MKNLKQLRQLFYGNDDKAVQEGYIVRTDKSQPDAKPVSILLHFLSPQKEFFPTFPHLLQVLCHSSDKSLQGFGTRFLYSTIYFKQRVKTLQNKRTKSLHFEQ